MMKVTFYFDYLSPYAYFAWHQFPQLIKQCDLQIIYQPIVLAGLLNHWGQKGPAEILPKRNYIFMQCLRIATREKIPFTLPKLHPFNPITALRLSLKEVAGEKQADVMAALWRGGWQQGRDLADVAELEKILTEAHLPAQELLAKTTQPEIKECLKAHTDSAIQKGVFGIPSFITEDNTLFWGYDSLPDLLHYAKGEEKFDKDYLKKILEREVGARRV